MIVVDTNVLYAATDRSDNHHRRCAEWITSTTDDLLVLPTVLAETCYLIDRALGANGRDFDNLRPRHRHALTIVLS